MAPFPDPSDPRPSLPDWIQRAYTVIEDAASGSPPELAYDEALERLEQDDALELGQSDAEHAIERLLQRGHLYEVDGNLRITDSLEKSMDVAETDESV